MPTPPLAPQQLFASDNVAGAHPQVLAALAAANVGSAVPYGGDPWTARAVDLLRGAFGVPAEVLFTYGGTGANVGALQSLLLPHEAVICPVGAHINTDEGGSAERFIGCKLIGVPTTDGKLRPEQIEPLMRAVRGEHSVAPRVVAISQATEVGTVYRVEELRALADAAHAHGLLLFLDGARIANAVASAGCTLQEMTVGAGVDVMTFGGTKNGLLYGEAVVYLRPELATRARFARKQMGQLASKMRFVSAQFEALLTDDLWLTGARHANAMAAKLSAELAGAAGVEILHAPEANSVFAALSPAAIAAAQAWSYFHTWDETASSVRWMTSFATTPDDVERFVAGIRHFAGA